MYISGASQLLKKYVRISSIVIVKISRRSITKLDDDDEMFMKGKREKGDETLHSDSRESHEAKARDQIQFVSE